MLVYSSQILMIVDSGSQITVQIGSETSVSVPSHTSLSHLTHTPLLPIAKLSPDAYIQMALQLAWYRSRGEFTATYETALTRMFARGRTETIRTLTVDSRAWVLSMVDRGASVCFFFLFPNLVLADQTLTASNTPRTPLQRTQNTRLPNSRSSNR